MIKPKPRFRVTVGDETPIICDSLSEALDYAKDDILGGGLSVGDIAEITIECIEMTDAEVADLPEL